MNEYAIEGPACVSFSGGRTSAYMLHQILTIGGGLRPDVHVLFENTGKERKETLDFIHECETRWSVRVRWVEYVRANPDARDGENAPPIIREVTFETASRKGEPFDQLLAEREADCAANGKDFYLPGFGARYCSVDLKTKVMRAWMLAAGYAEWTNVVGIRYDEPRRWAKYLANGKECWDYALPLYEARVTKRHHIRPFWASQPFDLGLEEWEGNCDLCFLKRVKSKVRVMRDRPDLADWWLAHEKRTGKTFRLDHAPLATLQRLDQSQADLFNDAETPPCVCDLEAA